ncbi:dynein beta chain, ciliary [Trichonephila clavipes]|nr:dynein beta chain, ciliary [Trichonephila clavipes]
MGHRTKKRELLSVKRDLPVGAESSESVLSLLLEDETVVGRWRNAGLPGDRASIENATLFTSCFLLWRWPLLIDPQIRAVPWIRNIYGDRLRVVRTDQKGYLDQIEEAVVAGQPVLVENLSENIDPLLCPLIFCNFVKKGKAIKLGTKEIPFHPDFQLILHTKLSNPRFGPEIQAQTTIIDFGVTTEGLADQLLAEVVSKERPDLEESKVKAAADIHRQITEIYDTEAMSDSKIRKWVRKFKDRWTNVYDEERSGRPSVITDDLRQAVETKIREKRRFTITTLSWNFRTFLGRWCTKL